MKVDSNYLKQALFFDIFDFALSMVISFYIFRVADQAFQQKQQAALNNSLDPLRPNNNDAVNDVMTNDDINRDEGGSISQLSASQYNYRQNPGAINDLTLPTQSNQGDNNSFIMGNKQRSTSKQVLPKKLTQSFIKEQLDHNQRSNSS